MNLSTKIMIVFALILFLFTVVTALNIKHSRRIKEESDWLTRSEEILRQSTLLQKFMIDMETGLRGFMLTNNDSFLEPYYAAEKNIPVLFASEMNMLSQNPVQLQRMHFIRDKMRDWRDSFAIPLIRGRIKANYNLQNREEYAVLLENKVKLQYGKRITDAVRAEFHAFDKLEYELRQDRRNILMYSLQRTETITLTLLILSLLISIVAATAITHIIMKRISGMVALAEKISEGNFNINIRDNTHDEMRKLTESLNRMTKKLRESFNTLERTNKELEQFAYISSHDLKEPLRMVTSYTQLLAKRTVNKLDDQEKAFMDFAIEGAQRMQSLINDIVEYSEVTRANNNFRPVDCNFSVKEAKENLKYLIADRNAEVSADVLPVISGIPLHICRLFYNLIENGLKFNNSPKPKVHISVKLEGSYWLFSVKDNGIGLDEKYHPKVFAIFQRLNERGKYTGTGIGLALCKKITELHGGKIWYQSPNGSGTIFFFTLPANQP